MYYLQCNILVLAWYKDGEFLELWEKIIIFLLLVFSLIVTLIGGTAVSMFSHVTQYGIVWCMLYMCIIVTGECNMIASST